MLRLVGERFCAGERVGDDVFVFGITMRWVRPERVRPVARFLCDNMAFFFLPAGVGIITSMDVLSRYWDIVLVVGTVTTLLVLIVVAVLQQWQEDHRAHGKTN